MHGSQLAAVRRGKTGPNVALWQVHLLATHHIERPMLIFARLLVALDTRSYPDISSHAS